MLFLFVLSRVYTVRVFVGIRLREEVLLFVPWTYDNHEILPDHEILKFGNFVNFGFLF